jgi:hypothetical protein
LDVFQKSKTKKEGEKMKKILAMFVVCMTVASTFAAITYKSSYFVDTTDKTVTPPVVTLGYTPVFMRGNWKPAIWEMDYKDGAALKDCNLVKGKDNMQVFLVFCQPCIMCIDKCEESLTLTDATLYIVEKDSKKKLADITVYPLVNQKITVTTGNKLKEATKGEVLISINGANQDTFGAISHIPLFGAWNRKNWFTGYDADSNNAKFTVKLSTIQKLDGTVSTAKNDPLDKLWSCGTLSLRRDDSFTKTLMLKMTVDSKVSSGSNPFEDCDPEEVTVKPCATVMSAGQSDIEAYIKKKAGIPSSWTDVDWHVPSTP